MEIVTAMEKTFTTPILFTIFNRPDLTKRVFEQIQKVRPAKLFIAADGPRPGNQSDAVLCRQTREVVEHINWPCEITRLYRDSNLGCKVAGSQAIRWFFDSVEEGIIIEDDTLPNVSFFNFCEEMLQRYRGNPRVMHISGVNVHQHDKNFNCQDSYYFSKFPGFWGWATWRRAWDLYDMEMRQWPTVRKSKQLCSSINDGRVVYRFGKKFQNLYEGRSGGWDGQWIFACFIRGGLTVYPCRNLISNIGFRPDAAHTTAPDPLWDSLPTEAMLFPLQHPKEIKLDSKAETYIFDTNYTLKNSRFDKAIWWIKATFPGPYIYLKKICYMLLWPKDYAHHIDPDERSLIC